MYNICLRLKPPQTRIESCVVLDNTLPDRVFFYGLNGLFDCYRPHHVDGKAPVLVGKVR